MKKNIWFFLPSKPIDFLDGAAAHCRLSRGWYMIQYQLISKKPFHKSNLLFYDRDEVITNGSVVLPHNQGRITKRLCYLSRRINMLKLERLDNRNDVKIKHFKMSRVSSNFSYDRMLNKIANRHPLYRGKSPDIIKSSFHSNNNDNRPLSLQLYDLYNECIEHLADFPHARFVSNPLISLNCDGKLYRIIADQKKAPRPMPPDLAAFMELTPAAKQGSIPKIDVIIPVFKGYNDTIACIYSVLISQCETPFELIVINDCSPDFELSRTLRELSQLGLITYLTNPANSGFVRSVNKGMKLHSDRDVVLLNSDTVVYPNWLDRLAFHASRKDVSTVTPLSNNATICSYPYEHQNNQDELEISFKELDNLCSDLFKEKAIEIPTGIGYCMYIRREVINKVGFFDDNTFDMGYGEENDFCINALKKGYRNLFALDIFVRHTGEVSFSKDSQKRQDKAIKSLLKKHPDYMGLVNDYINKSPAKSYRRMLDATRIKKATQGRSMLFVVNARTGGILRYLRDREKLLYEHGTGLIILSPMIVNSCLTYINTLTPLIVPNLCGLHLRDDMGELSNLLKIMGVESISINSLVDWPMDTAELIQELAGCSGLNYEFVVHDYTSICPLITMTNKNGYHCWEPDQKACQKCLDQDPNICGSIDISDWRNKYAELFRNAQSIIAPSNDAVQRMERYFPGISVRYQPHEETIEPPAAPMVSSYEGGVIRVAVIGAINPPKGSNVLLACAKDAYRRNLPLKFVVIGYTDKDGSFGNIPNVEITGPYRDADIYGILDEKRCHAAFFPSICPETYCYSLSHAINAGLPCISFDIGAQAERLKNLPNPLILDRKYFDIPEHINNSIMEYIENDPMRFDLFVGQHNVS